ncbi:MAG: response regulator [Candidatus Dormibacteraceae bacterium]
MTNGQPSPSAFILVVEDNPANQLLIQFTLESSGYHVEVAGSAQEAIVSIDRRIPDLILMDIQLPGQDGLSLTRQLKADPAMKAVPVVALTARAMVGDRELCLAAGCSGYITKPIDTRGIVEEVARFLSAAK